MCKEAKSEWSLRPMFDRDPMCVCVGVQVGSEGYHRAKQVGFTGPSPLQEWVQKPECLQQFRLGS